METLETLAKILRRLEPTLPVRRLRADIRLAMATDRATDSDVAELRQRALRLIRGKRDVAL